MAEDLISKYIFKAEGIKEVKAQAAQLGGYLAMLIDHHPSLTVDWCYTVVVGPNRCKLLQNEPDECLMQWVDCWDNFRLENCPF